MKTKITQFIPVLLALLVIGFSYFSQWCTSTGQICFRTVLDRMIPEITYPLYFFAFFLLPIAIILVFIPRTIFNSWLKFAVWAIPLAIIFIALTPVSFTGLGLDFFPFYRDDAARLAGQVFSAISLILIIWKFIRSKFVSSASGNENCDSSNMCVDTFSFKSLTSYILAPLLTSVFLILFALEMPWKGGLISDNLAIFFGLAFAGSTYALIKGFFILRRRGLGGWRTFAWYIGVLTAIAIAIDILIFGFALFNVAITIPIFSDFSSPTIFRIFVIFQALYFLSEAIWAAAASRVNHHIENWYVTTYLSLLAINAAAIIFGPFAAMYF